MKKTALIIMIITLFSKFLGFGRDITLSYFFGASSVTDAYLISLTVPSVIFGFIGVGIITAYIPMQSSIISESGDEKANLFTSNFTNIILLITTLIFFLGIGFTDYIVKIFAIGFTGETLSLAIKFTKISLFGIYFTALIYIFSGFLQIKNNFIIPTLIGFPLNVVIIISIFIASRGNYSILALGTLIASGSQVLLMIPFIKKENFKYKFFIDFKDEKIIKTFYLALPAILGASVNQVNVLIDKTLASSLAVGGISALNYADKLNIFIQGIFVYSIVTSMYPIISKYACENNFEGIKKTILESISIVSLIIIPGSIGAMLYSTEIVDLLFGRGAFDVNALYMTSTALFFYSIGMLGYAMRDVMARGFYSIQDTKTPMINATIGVIINIVLNIILSRYMGIGGLALATSISAIVTAILLYITIQKKIGKFNNKKFITSFLKILLASITMGGISRVCYKYMIISISPVLSLLVSVLLGMIIYAIEILYMKIPEVEIIIEILKAKMKIKL